MSGELKHSDPGAELSQAEYIAVGAHTIDGGQNGDMVIYDATGGVIKRFPVGAEGSVIKVVGSVPTWGQVTVENLADGLLTADVTGRAKMQDGFVTQAKLGSDTLRCIYHNITTWPTLVNYAPEYTTDLLGYAKFRFDKSRIPSIANVVFFVTAQMSSTPCTGKVRLKNMTTGVEVVGSEIVVSSPQAMVLMNTGNLYNNLHSTEAEYAVEVMATVNNLFVFGKAYLLISW
jgi:hypothetical protein